MDNIDTTKSGNDDSDEQIIIPKMKTVNKPKNLRKRKRDSLDDNESAESTKKTKLDETEDKIELIKLEETRLVQQMRSARQRGSDMSSENVLDSKAAIEIADDQTIGSLTQNFTVQREKVNTLDKRMEEFIEQEMQKLKAKIASGELKESDDNIESSTKNNDISELEAEALKEENEKKVGGLSATSSSTQDASFKPAIIDLSNTVLKVASSSSSHGSSQPEAERKHYRSEGRTTAGILEIDLPVEEQLKMIEETKKAALKAMYGDHKRDRPKRTAEQTGFEAIDGNQNTTAGNLSSDFSKHKRYAAPAATRGKATDELVYDKFKKKQAQMFR